jgi:phosphotransferase system  glucose/maltose/N-acetylglucosamine-specific IIC component
MFENRTEKELIVIYVIIALAVTFLLGLFHYFTWTGPFQDPIVLIIIGNIEFFIIFYILYFPLKIKKAKEKKEQEKKRK